MEGRILNGSMEDLVRAMSLTFGNKKYKKHQTTWRRQRKPGLHGLHRIVDGGKG